MADMPATFSRMNHKSSTAQSFGCVAAAGEFADNQGENMRARLLLIAFCSFLVAPGAWAQAYKCGNTYSQTPCGPEAKAVEVQPNGTASLGGSRRMEDTATSEQKRQSEAECQRAVVSRLKDPESARFRDVTRVGVFLTAFPMRGGPDRKVAKYSGWVNAKNSYGGYTGDKLFSCAVLETTPLSVEVFFISE